MALFQIRRGSSSSKRTLGYGEPYLNSDSQSVVFGVDSNEEITLVKLNKGASSDSRWAGAYANSGSLSLTGDITASNAYFRGVVAEWDYANVTVKLTNVKGNPTSDLLIGDNFTLRVAMVLSKIIKQ